MTNDTPGQSPADDIARLRGSLGDLVDVMAQPALWIDGELPSSVRNLLHALPAMVDSIAQRTSELEATNQALQERDRESRAVIDTLPAGIALMAPYGEVEFINRPMRDYFGKPFEELKGWVTGNAVHPDDLPRVIEKFQRSIQTGEPYDNEQRQLRHDGDYRWFHVRGMPLRDDTGQVKRWCILHSDIDERKRAEEARSESERESRLIVDSIPGLVALLSPSGEVEVVNRQILDYFGQTLDELKGWGTSGIIHPDDLPHVAAAFSAAIAAGVPYDILQRFRRADGEFRWFQNSGFPLRDSDGTIVRWCVLLTDIDERQRAEDALRESEREARLIVDSIPGQVLIMNTMGTVELVNRQILDYLGKGREELSNLEEFIHPDDLARVIAAWSRSITTSEPLEMEHRVRRADGVYRWLHARGLPLRDSSGAIVRWYTLLTDVDERKHAEEALRASEQNLALIIGTIPAMAWSARADGTADFFNQHYLKFVGLTAEEASGWGWTAAVHPDDLAGLAQIWQNTLALEIRGEAEARLRRYDGEYRWFLFRVDPLRDETGEIVKWYGVNTDIEDRKRAEAELRRAYDSIADAQRLSKTGSFITDLVGDDHNWSDETYRIFDFDPQSLVTLERIANVIHPDDLPSFESMIARAMTGVDVTFAFRIVTERDTLKYIRGVAHVIEQVEGRPMFVGALQDVTESMVAEEALSKARAELTHVARVTALGALTASIAHEVNQPLAGIITNAGTCLRMLDADPPNIEGARETARRTIRDGNRASDVITRLRALFSRKELTLEVFNLNEAMREVIALSLSELQRNRVVLQLELADDLPPVTGDRIQLQQVMLNLIRNASDAMENVHDLPRRLRISSAREEGDRVRLSVCDAGVGLLPEGTSALFDAFATTKSGGMGIGLFVSRSIIESHQGRLWAEPNSSGNGATFAFSIPRTWEPALDVATGGRTA